MKTSQAIKQAGSIKKLAALLDITTTAIYAWRGVVPELRALQLEKLMREKKAKK